MRIFRSRVWFRASLRVAGLASCCLVMGAATVWAQARPTSGPVASKVFVSVGGGQQSASPAFSAEWATTVHAEPARFEARYPKRGGSLVDVGGGVRVWRRLFIGAAVTRSAHTRGAEITGSIPHPFVFQTLRGITGTAGGLKRAETAVHVQAMWRIPLARRFDLTLLAGPSWTSVNLDLVQSVSFDESYPYDSASYRDAQIARKSATAGGFHVGADFSYHLLRRIGVGVQVRRTSGTADIDLLAGSQASVKVGGTQISAGARFAF